MSAAAAPYERTRPLGKHAWLSVLGGLVMALAMTQNAAAYWTGSGTGSGSGSVGTLAAPTISSATPGAGTATLSWGAITPPGPGAVTYFVQRNGGDPAGNCPKQAAPAAVFTCTDSGLSAGTYSYTVTAVWMSWTATSSPATVTLAFGAASKLAFTAQPGGGASSTAWTNQPTVTVQDAGGNTVTTATNSINLTITTPAGAILTCTANPKNAVAGVDAFAGCRIDKAGTYTLTATAAGLTGATSSAFNITAGAASKLAFTAQPTNTVAGVAITPAVAVTVQDIYGNTVTTSAASITIAIGTNPGGGTLSGTKTVAAVNGVATFSDLSIDKASSGYTLTAASSGLAGATSSAFNITVGPATKLAFTAQPTNTVAGVAITPAVTVTVQDAGGNTITSGVGSNASITIAIGTNPGGGTLSGTKTVAAVNGVATFSNLSIDKTGTGYTLTAASSGLTGATSGTFNIAAAAANRLVFTAQPTNTTGGATISPVAVTVQDTYGNTVTSSNASITIAIGTNPSGGTLSGTTTVNAVNGVATFSNLSIDRAGSGYTLTAASSPLTGATSSAFNITVGAASKLAFTAQPGGGASSTAWTNQPTVTVQDAGGNTVTTATNSITLTITTPGGAILTCAANPKNAVAGVDAFAGCSIDKAGTYTLTATATGLTGAGSSAFNITVGAATKLAFTAQPGGGANGTAWTNQPTVTVQDAGGNTVTTAANSITLTITTPAGATLTCTTNPKNAVAGVDAFAGCRIDRAGTYTLTATATGLASAVSNSFIITATVTFSSGPALGWNNYLPTHVRGSGFSGSVTISWSYAWSGYVYSTTAAADGSGNFAWDGLENCIDGYGVYWTTDQTVVVNATDGTHAATGTGTLLCSLRPTYP